MQPNYIIPVAVQVTIKRVGEKQWKPHLMKERLEFDDFKTRFGMYYTFGYGDWLIEVDKNHVIRRDNEYGH